MKVEVGDLLEYIEDWDTTDGREHYCFVEDIKEGKYGFTYYLCWFDDYAKERFVNRVGAHEIGKWWRKLG